MNAKQYTISAKKQCKQKGNANSHIQAAIHLLFIKCCSFHTGKSIGCDYPDAHFVQLGQIENGVNEGAVLCNVKTAFSFTPSSIVT